MLRINGRVSVTGAPTEQSRDSLVCAQLPRCVIFVPTHQVAEKILNEGADAAIKDAVHDDWALVWMSMAQGPVQKLCFDSQGVTTCDVSFSLASWELRVAAGSKVELGPDENSYVIRGQHEGAITFGSLPVENQRIEIGGGGSPLAGQIMFSGVMPSLDERSSLRYFYSSGPTGPVAGFKYPIFHATPPAQSLPVTVRIDPAHAAHSERNQLLINAANGADCNFLSVAGELVQLGIIPDKSGIAQQWDPVEQSLYPVPMGDWRLSSGATGTTGATGNIDLMCGLSGLEYAKVSDGSIVRFVPNSPAYAPHFLTPSATGSTQALIADAPGSILPVTTSWVYFSSDGPKGLAEKPVLRATTGPAGPEGYYSQPSEGGLFQVDPGDNFLQVLQLQTAEFPLAAPPVFGAPEASFPMVPYAGVRPANKSETDLYNRFEIEVLSPTRSNAIFAMNQPVGELEAGLRTLPLALTGATGPMAVTPQGMLSTFSPDYSVWRRLIMATTGEGATLELQDLNFLLRAALLTNQLFLVVSDPTVLADYCQIHFPELNLSGWRFNLSPDSWRADTVLILKFAEKSLESLIDDISLWSAPGSGLNDGIKTQTVLKNSIAEARANKDRPEFQYFLNTVLKAWNGILFLNLKVPPSDLPQQLQGLAAGIDITMFKAHHLGVNLSPVQVINQQLRISDSALFALINYEDPTDLTYQGNPYDFKVLSLRVLFANSDISSFSSRIELLVGDLFGERSTLRNVDPNNYHGDNLVLNGVMQKHGTEQSYSFTEEGADTFDITSKVLDTVLITKAQFITLDPSQSQPNEVASRFILRGVLRFQKLPELDIFSFGSDIIAGPQGGLAFSNLFISMNFQQGSPTGPTGPSGPSGPPPLDGPIERAFAFHAGQMVFDPSLSTARAQSLYSRFPLQVRGMLQGDAQSTPAALGFIQVTTPLQAGSLEDTWFGLQMALSLGSQGSLAAKGSFEASLLAAWSPSPDAYDALLAIQLPGSEGGSKNLTIEGPLKLSIGDIAMLFNANEQAYMMRFSNIALSFLSLKFPPGGRTNLLLFGDPNPQGANTTLGWYAAYMKNPSKTGPTGPTAPTGRILPPKGTDRLKGPA